MSVLHVILPIVITLFVWWFTTGLIIAVYDRSRAVMRACFGGATLALGLAFVGLLLLRSLDDVLAVYLAASCGVLIWGWQTASYYLGFITGPHPTLPANAERLNLRERFTLALGFSLYHEVIAIATGVLIALLVWDQPNQWGLWMYLTLWTMHASAKLNVFLGVRNFRVDVLPHAMHPIGRLLNPGKMNALFPVSIVLASGASLSLIAWALLSGADVATLAGALMVATMIALGVLEHWLLVLPVPKILVGWGLRHVDEPEQHPPRLETPAKAVAQQCLQAD